MGRSTVRSVSGFEGRAVVTAAVYCRANLGTAGCNLAGQDALWPDKIDASNGSYMSNKQRRLQTFVML